MKPEIEKVRQQHEALHFPSRPAEAPGSDPAEEIPELERSARRRAVRTQTDSLIDNGIGSNDLLRLATELGATMTVAAGTCVQFGIEPSVQDFAYGLRELIEDARILVDKGIQLREWDQARIGLVMLEIVVRGAATCLNIPLEEVFNTLHESYLLGAAPDETKIAVALRAAGHVVGAANEE